MELLELEELIDKEYNNKVDYNNQDIENIIANLIIYSDDANMLTKAYTNILLDDNVMYILTRISQDPIFKQHFPEFYIKNQYGESVINCQQNTVYHRYGVFKHTLCAVENVGKDSLKFNSQELKVLKWTMLLHDIGKPHAKVINDMGTDSFAGHDDVSCEMASNILDRFSFTEEEKKVILALIKYHDKYLNDGDLTYDNFSFLASELNDKKELFYLLIEVKSADNKAKSIDVYNKFLNTQNKYYEFASEYFNNAENNRMFGTAMPNNKVSLGLDNKDHSPRIERKLFELTEVYEDGGSSQEITEKMIIGLCRDITAGKSLKFYYQPIIDLNVKSIIGYEVYYKILTDENFSYDQIIRKAKEFEKYDKLQQMLFINALNAFESFNPSKEMTQYINIDVRSYKNYVNKSRIFDIVSKRNVVIEFNNFETLNSDVLKKITSELHKSRAHVGIDNFESSNKSMKDIDNIDPKVVKYKLEKCDQVTKKELQELETFCTARTINLIVFGIDTKEKLTFVSDIGIRYVQGDYFRKPTEDLDMVNGEVEALILQAEEENIA